MDLQKSQQQLFQRWKAERNDTGFLSDGVFDAATWNKQKIKITFVLKEANWPGGNADLCQFLLKGRSSSYWKTWNNIARWSKALLAGGEYPCHVSVQDKTYWLSRVSFINLKKTGGGRRTNNRALREYAKRDAAWIRQQFALYKPDIILCCGRPIVADILYSDVFSKDAISEWEAPLHGINYFYVSLKGKPTPVPVVSFYHPQRIASHALYREWYAKIRQIGGELLK